MVVVAGGDVVAFGAGVGASGCALWAGARVGVGGAFALVVCPGLRAVSELGPVGGEAVGSGGGGPGLFHGWPLFVWGWGLVCGGGPCSCGVGCVREGVGGC